MMAQNEIKKRAQDLKRKVQSNVQSLKSGNFLEEREKILGEEKPEVFPKIRSKVEGWEPGQNVKDITGGKISGKIMQNRGGGEPPIKRPGQTQARQKQQPQPQPKQKTGGQRGTEVEVSMPYPTH